MSTARTARYLPSLSTTLTGTTGEKGHPEDIKRSIEFCRQNPGGQRRDLPQPPSAIAGSKTGDTFNDTSSGIAIDGQKIIITFDKIAPDALLTFTQFAPVPKSEFEGIDPLQVQQAPSSNTPSAADLSWWKRSI